MSPKLFIFIILASICVLFARYFFFYQDKIQYIDGQEIFLQVTLYEEPELSNRGQRFMARDEQNQRIYILSSLNTLYHYGDRLAIAGTLQVRQNDKDVTFYNLNFPKISALPRSQNPLSMASLFVREKSMRLFKESLPQTSASLLAGIVFGAKEDFPDEFYQKLKTTGVLHVIAASGMNVSFFTGAVMFSLGAFLKRQLAILLSIFAVIFYSFLVGFEPSILRASTMAIIAFTANFFGRQNLAIMSLFGTGFLMLLWQPAYLFDVGFQLSFMATLGILVIGEALGKLGKLGLLGEDFKTTFSAQIATFPILLGTFGNVGVLSLLVNVMVLWTVPILMLLGSLGVLAGLVLPAFGKLFILISLPFLLFFEKIIDIFGGLNLIVQMDAFPWELGLGYYLIVVGIVVAFYKRAGKQKTGQK